MWWFLNVTIRFGIVAIKLYLLHFISGEGCFDTQNTPLAMPLLAARSDGSQFRMNSPSIQCDSSVTSKAELTESSLLLSDKCTNAGVGHMVHGCLRCGC